MGDLLETWYPCHRCGEPDQVLTPGALCRDCQIERAFAAGSCRECLRWIVREEYGGPRETQHATGCSLSRDRDYAPRTEQEINAVCDRREGRADG